MICRYILNNYMVNSCFSPPFFLLTCITRITLFWVQFLGLICPGCKVYYIEKHVIHLGFNVYNIEKHVIRLGFQSVLNRKACYTPRFSKCIKSKSMLYIQYSASIHPCITCLTFYGWTTSQSNCIYGVHCLFQ